MALDFQTVSLSLTEGIDTKSDPKSVVIGKLLTLENAVFTKPGELLKRYGYAPMTRSILASSGSPTLSVGTNINAYLDNVVISDGSYVYAYASESGKWSKADGQISSTKLHIDGVISGLMGIDTTLSGQTNIYASNAVASDGTEGYVTVIPINQTTNYSTVQFTVFSPISKTIVYSVSRTFSATTAAYVATIQAIGNTYYVFVSEQTSLVPAYALMVYSFSSSAPVSSWPAGTSLTTVKAVNLDSAKLGTAIYLTYNGTLVRKYDTSGGATSVQTLTGTGTVGCSVSTDSSNNRIWVSCLSNATLYIESFNTSLVSQATYNAAVAGALTTAIASDSGRVVAFADTAPWVLGGTLTKFPTIHTAGTVVLKPVFDTTRFYVGFQSPGTTQNSIFLCSAILGISDIVPTFGRILSKWAEGEAYSLQLLTQFPLSISGSVVSTGFLINKSSTYFSTTGAIQAVIVPIISVQRAEVTLNQKAQGTVAGKVLNYLAGMPSFYDNKRTVGIGFNQYPETASFAAQNVLGGAMGLGTYSYQIVYAYVDTFGQVTRSAPSAAFQVTLSGAQNTVRVTTDVPTYTDKPSVIVELYRTTAGGTTYHITNSTLIETTTSGTWSTGSVTTMQDNTPDTVLTANRQIYTNGGEVDNIAPPVSRIGCIYKTRFMLVPDEARSSLWYSKDIIPGAPVEFSDLFVMNVDPRGGDINAVAQLDDKLIIFKRDMIFYTAGSGPSPNGLNNDFQEPLLIASDTGCLDRDSVVVTPLGVLFKSPKGIYLLGRNLNLEYKGADVESFNSYTVTSATLIEDKNQVRFTLNTSSFLVYDYYAGQWSVFKPLTAVDACNYGTTYAYLDSSGFVYNETPNLFLDGSNGISMKLVTGWLSLAKLQGFQRVRRLLFLGEYKSAHTLTVQFAHDFGSVSQTTVVTPTVDQVPYQWDVALVRQKSQAVQLTIYDTPTAPYGESLSLSTLSFEVGIKRGLNKVKAAWST